MDKSILLDFLANVYKYPRMTLREQIVAYLADLEKPKEDNLTLEVLDIAGNVCMDTSGNFKDE